MLESTNSFLSRASLTELVTKASHEPVLDEDAEAELARRVRDGDTEALERLVFHNLRIAVDEAIRNRGLGEPQGVLLKEGVHVLVSAARTYDPDRHGSFSRYAGTRVRRALSENAGSA